MDGEWVSITEAAERLTAGGDPVDRSTLSRYVTQHAEAIPTHVRGRSRMVDLETLTAHRAENIRLGPGRLPATIIASPKAPLPGQPAKGRFAGSQADGAARKAIADAELREMDLAERRRELTPVAEVDEAGRAAVVLMTSAFERAIESEAATLALKYGWDERQTRVALKGFTRRGLEVFHKEVLDRLDGMRRARDDGCEAAAAMEQPLQ